MYCISHIYTPQIINIADSVVFLIFINQKLAILQKMFSFPYFYILKVATCAPYTIATFNREWFFPTFPDF